MNCTQCEREFADEDRLASISGSICGDECTDVYYLCPVCRVFTVANWWDNFTGDETMNISGPLEEQDGMERVALIKRCSEPWDKKCRCKAHLEYFRNTLD
jgi:hypothetical protein